MKTKEEALEFLKWILPKTQENPEGEMEGSDKFAILLEGVGVGGELSFSFFFLFFWSGVFLNAVLCAE